MAKQRCCFAAPQSGAAERFAAFRHHVIIMGRKARCPLKYTYTVNIIFRENALTSETIGRNMGLSKDNGVSRAYVPARRCLFFCFLDHRQEVPYGRI
jgi:hypothetical protein